MSLSRPFCLPAIAAFTLALTLTTAGADNAGPGRYQMQHVDGGVVRLDTLTGAMTLCLKRADTLDCGPADDERRMLTNRIDALQRRVDRLERQADEHAAGTPSGPTDRQLDEAMDTAKRVMRHFFGMVQDLQKELRKPGEPERDQPEGNASPGAQHT